jgi:hypothetical protein
MGLMLGDMEIERAPRQHRTTDPEVSRVAKQAFFRLMEIWGLSEAEALTLLGQPSRSTLHAWRKGAGGKLDRDRLDRISYLLGIHKALQVLFPERALADGWLKKPNARFGGRSALAYMLEGSLVRLADVRRQLDNERG